MSLLVWLPLDNNLKNKGTKDVTVTVSGTTSYVDGKIGKGLSCDGSSFWTITPITLGNKVSICWWAKTTDDNGMFWQLESNANDKLNIWLKDSVYYLNIGDSTQNPFQNVTAPTDENWHHYVNVFNGTDCSLYIDGNYVGKAQTYRNPTTTNGKIKIGGGYRDTHNNDLNGIINDFRVYNEVLSDLEIKELSKGLVLHYKLDEINSTSVCASSGYGCHGTTVGTYTLNTDSPKYSHCVYMDNTSTGNHIETPDFSKISDNIFSVSFWVKASKTKSQVLFGYTSKMVIAIHSSSILFLSPTAASGFSMAKFNTDEWNHIVAIRNNSSYYLYINGEKITSRSGSNNFVHNDNKIYLLNRKYNNNYGANASMSDFRLYATVLTEDDVKYLYNVGAKIDNLKNLHCFELSESTTNVTRLHKSGTFETNEFIEEDDTMSIKNTKKVNSNKFIEI